MADKGLLSDTIVLNPTSSPYNESALKDDPGPPPAYQYPKLEVNGGCKNPVFAVLFWIHTVCVITLGLVFGVPALMYYVKNYTRDERAQAPPLDLNVELFICIFLGSAAVGGFTAFLALVILLQCGGHIIKCSLIIIVLLEVVICAGLFVLYWPAGILPAIILLLTLWYIFAVRKRIPFAEVHLQVGCAALRSRPSLILVAIGMLFVQLLWIFFWSMMVLGVGHAINTRIASTDVNSTTNLTNATTYLSSTKPFLITTKRYRTGTKPYWTTANPSPINSRSKRIDPEPSRINQETGRINLGFNRTSQKPSRINSSNLETELPEKNTAFSGRGYIGGIITFFLFLSFYWGVITFRNIVHFITACVVGQWWFEEDTNGQYALGTSIKRAFTTNFGTIAFGSLLVAVIKALRTCAESNNRRGGNFLCAIFACIAGCILSILEKVLGYLNEWAFIYAALTGQGFVDASKSFIALFKDRGWTMVINDSLTGTALSLVTLVVGLISATSGGLVAYVFMPDSQQRILVSIIAAVFSFFMGISMSTIMISVLISCVRTAFVCFALNPAALGSTHPEHLTMLINAWHKFHPEEYVASGYAQHLPPPTYAESV